MITSIKITGIPIKEPLKKKESVELLFKGAMSNKVSKLLRSSDESLFIVNIPNPQWSKISSKVKSDSVFFVEGELSASLTRSGKPCINVAGKHILLRDLKDNAEAQTEIAAETKNTSEIQGEKNKSKNDNLIMFRENVKDQLIDVALEDVILTEEIHTTNLRKSVLLSGIFDKDNTLRLFCLIIRKLDNGKYSLVSGFKSYATCKVYDVKTSKAYVTDLNHEEFEKMIEGYDEQLKREEEERNKKEEEERKRIEEEKIKEEIKKKEEEKQKKKDKYDKALKNKKIKSKK